MKNWLWRLSGDLEDWCYFRIGGLTPVRRSRLREAEAEIERGREDRELLIRTLARVGREAGYPAPPRPEEERSS